MPFGELLGKYFYASDSKVRFRVLKEFEPYNKLEKGFLCNLILNMIEKELKVLKVNILCLSSECVFLDAKFPRQKS